MFNANRQAQPAVSTSEQNTSVMLVERPPNWGSHWPLRGHLFVRRLRLIFPQAKFHLGKCDTVRPEVGLQASCEEGKRRRK